MRRSSWMAACFVLLTAVLQPGCKSFSATARGDNWAFWTSSGGRHGALTAAERERVRNDRTFPTYDELKSHGLPSFGERTR